VIVLDTHIWFWWMTGEHARLSRTLLEALASEPAVGVSPVSCFEIALASRRRRLELPVDPRTWVHEALGPSGIDLLPLDADIAVRAVELPEHHRDPFDRMIIATALVLDAQLASVDSAFAAYDELSGRLLT
jgi:PIN domain nuclease of toxin-antitoxin system